MVYVLTSVSVSVVDFGVRVCVIWYASSVPLFSKLPGSVPVYLYMRVYTNIVDLLSVSDHTTLIVWPPT